MSQENRPNIIGRSCKFASTHTVNRDVAGGRYRYEKDDLTLIKEEIFFEDGTSRPNVRMVENYERPFWITKQAFRDHQSKKEWELKDHVTEYFATQSTLNERVQQALGVNIPGGIRRTNRNPYVYGTDMTTPVWIRMNYANKWKEQHGFPNAVCFYDIETDVLGDFALSEHDKAQYGDAIILITISYIHGKVIKSLTCALEGFINKHDRLGHEKFFEILDRDLPHVRRNVENGDLNAQIELKLFKTEKELIHEIFKTLHAWSPDIVSTWNIAFDVPRTAERMRANGMNPDVYFSDPRVPEKYRRFEFKEDAGSKTSVSGKKNNKLFYQCWHMVKAPAGFRWVDACAVYWYVRKHKGNLVSAALDFVLNKEIKRGKFEIEEAEKYQKLEKHIFMQRKYPIEYSVYNLYDCIGLIELERKTKDLSLSLAGMTGISELEHLPSNPKKLMNNFMEFLYFKRNRVLGTTSDNMVDDLDKYIVSQRGWISTLPTNSIEYHGLALIKERPNMPTGIYPHCADLDVKSSYPTTTIFANVSRETTVMEVSYIDGVDDEMRYIVGLNLMGGRMNASTFCQRVYKMPNLEQLRKLYRERPKKEELDW